MLITTISALFLAKTLVLHKIWIYSFLS